MENYIIQEDLKREYNQTSVNIAAWQLLCDVNPNINEWGQALIRSGESIDIVHTNFLFVKYEFPYVKTFRCLEMKYTTLNKNGLCWWTVKRCTLIYSELQ
jgi:hypothetical protein